MAPENFDAPCAPPKRKVQARKAKTAPDTSTWMLQTLQSLDINAAAFNRHTGEVLWRSAEFNALVGGDDTTVAKLCARLQGLQQALENTVAKNLSTTLFWAEHPLDAMLSFHENGLTTLHLEDRASQAQAQKRHLEDREQLLFTSRLLSIGEMATTLAHEINQPIGAATNLLRGSVMRLQRQIDQGDTAADPTPLLQALQRATEQVLFASKVIARIREYTHSHTPKRVNVDIVNLLKDCVSLLDWEIERETVQLQLDLPSTPLPTLADEVMLQQLFVNLMRNAIDAMRASSPEQRVLGICARIDGPQIEVTISDTGSGISEQAEKTLFVPFVSSKPTGTGIGLNICRSFVELHQGRLWFTRHQGPGTSFHAALPLLSA